MSKPTLQDQMDEVESLISVISKDITEITQILKEDTIGQRQIKDPICKNIEGTPIPTYSRYSPPNYMVGDPELGSSGNPNALRWPFGETPK